jgi:hypothetical protein
VLKRLKRYHSSKEYRLSLAGKLMMAISPHFLPLLSIAWSLRNTSKQFKSAVRRIGADDSFSTHWMRHGTAFSVLRSDMGKDYQDKMLLLMGMLEA